MILTRSDDSIDVLRYSIDVLEMYDINLLTMFTMKEAPMLSSLLVSSTQDIDLILNRLCQHASSDIIKTILSFTMKSWVSKLKEKSSEPIIGHGLRIIDTLTTNRLSNCDDLSMDILLQLMSSNSQVSWDVIFDNLFDSLGGNSMTIHVLIQESLVDKDRCYPYSMLYSLIELSSSSLIDKLLEFINRIRVPLLTPR